MADLPRLAELIKIRNAIAGEIAELIGRPALVGHVGEHLAAEVFGIALEESASQPGYDGRFIEGPLKGCTVNVKWYTKREGLIDLNPDALPDFYLVLAGPREWASSSRGKVRPWVIEAVHLFDARELVNVLRARGRKVGIASSVIQSLWDDAEIYPIQRNNRLLLSDEQRGLLALFQ